MTRIFLEAETGGVLWGGQGGSCAAVTALDGTPWQNLELLRSDLANFSCAVGVHLGLAFFVQLEGGPEAGVS